MSNNIYDILKKMQSLETPKANLTEGKKAKPDFLDMDKDGDTTEPMKKAAKAKSKGAVAEAVAQVERQLNEKYQGFKEDTRLAMRSGPGADMKRYEKDSPAPGAKQHRDATAKAAKAFRSAGGKMSTDVEVGRNAMAQPSRNDKGNAALGDKQLVRYSKTNEGEANEDMLSPKQKKFAKLAPPPDKITYADKIAGAKKTNEGFPTVADAKKRMDDRDGKTSHGKKTATKTGLKHERDYDAVDKGADVDTTPKGRGRPKKDRFA